MAKFIGCKIIEAEPCKAWKDMGEHKTGDDGYKVTYPDGYVSWSPKDVFEKAYIETPYEVTQEELHNYTKGTVAAIACLKIMGTKGLQ